MTLNTLNVGPKGCIGDQGRTGEKGDSGEKGDPNGQKGEKGDRGEMGKEIMLSSYSFLKIDLNHGYKSN